MKLVSILAMLLLGQTAPPVSIDGLPLGAIPRQTLPEHGCAAFLWSVGTTRALVAWQAPTRRRCGCRSTAR